MEDAVLPSVTLDVGPEDNSIFRHEINGSTSEVEVFEFASLDRIVDW